MGIPNLKNGFLPLGRWTCTPSELQATFATNSRRKKLWSDWTQATTLLRHFVDHIPSAWISGSYLTDKSDPGDIDCLYVIDSEDYLRCMNHPVVATFTQSKVKTLLNLEVDSYVLTWDPLSEPLLDHQYYRLRGYWDDLWLRIKDPSNARVGALPRRGYLEVIIDGYK